MLWRCAIRVASCASASGVSSLGGAFCHSRARLVASALTTISERTPPSARSSSRAAPERRWPVATGTARASTFSSAAAAETRLIFTAALKVSDRGPLSSQVFGHQLEHVRDAKLHVALAGRGRDVHQAARVV